ncbi:unnamed protein product [Callosobruchus maculatus]|uniref:Uncharacterized protein n=1 Tax=Callosobruchus maculatus TaxID=64391 RepID=A0A653BTX2_CALMS|nr:unnamed protein product [Callosobruchus maculatus]
MYSLYIRISRIWQETGFDLGNRQCYQHNNWQPKSSTSTLNGRSSGMKCSTRCTKSH